MKPLGCEPGGVRGWWAPVLEALILIELVRRDALDAVAVPNKTSLLNTGHKDIAGEHEEQQKTPLRFVPTSE